MLFAAFTGASWVCSWVRERIDTRLLTYNVFYREKTFLRQLFFRQSATRLWMREVGSTTKTSVAHDVFRKGTGFMREKRFTLAANADAPRGRDVEEQQRLQGRL
ncbi:hypothetical protein NKJ23_00585 [Mesorhizobium sp. M0184]|uniref:hypothetical protein n=1 Tax=unclassified Mesorhizobium TaxID=325217 RepID=UPI003336CBFC